IYNVIKSSRGPRHAPADPWNGATLEWSIPSPPQEWNFNEVPTVHGRDPLWEAKRLHGGPLPEPARSSGAGIHLPNPSYWPVVAAVGLLGLMVGVMMVPAWGPWGMIGGGAILFFGVFSWVFEPAG
ncbi:MAG: cytochrome ubiquinol oxidase subunit I, partial [Gemmatimonadales bacterium]